MSAKRRIHQKFPPHPPNKGIQKPHFILEDIEWGIWNIVDKLTVDRVSPRDEILLICLITLLLTQILLKIFEILYLYCFSLCSP